MGATKKSYRMYLELEYQARSKRNASYSLRAFARDIGMSAPKLSQVLKGTCGLSTVSARRLAKRLPLSEIETEHFVALVGAEHNRSRAGKEMARAVLENLETTKSDELDLERFRIIADWFHFAILELCEVRGFRSNAGWIAKRLGISLRDAKVAILRLLDHGLLVETASGSLKPSTEHLATPSGIPSRELKNHHQQILTKAMQAVESVPVNERDFSATTLAIDSSQIAEAQEALREFRRRFCRELQARSPKDRVYCLSIQLFPIDQKEEVSQ